MKGSPDTLNRVGHLRAGNSGPLKTHQIGCLSIGNGLWSGSYSLKSRFFHSSNYREVNVHAKTPSHL